MSEDGGSTSRDDYVEVACPRVRTFNIIDEFVDSRPELFPPGDTMALLIQGCGGWAEAHIGAAIKKQSTEGLTDLLVSFFEFWDTRVHVEVAWADRELSVHLIGVDSMPFTENGWVSGLASWLAEAVDRTRSAHEREWIVNVCAFGVTADATAGRAETMRVTRTKAKEMQEVAANAKE